MRGNAGNPREQAIAWMVVMQSGRSNANLENQFDAWLNADPAHQVAWGELQHSVGRRLNALRSLEGRKPAAVEGVRTLLVENAVNRRDVLRALTGMGVVGAGLVILGDSSWGQIWLADLSTGIGQRRNFVLDDGSHLSLNACSSVDFLKDAERRILRLRQGELIVQVSQDAHRPFIVQAPHGEIRALGTRFLVRDESTGTAVTVLEHSVQLTTPSGATAVLEEGQSAFMQRESIRALATEQRFRAEWLQGRLRVDDEPLSAVIAALRPYLSGYLNLSASVSSLRVTGVFSLDKPQQSLTTLEETLPISVRRFGPWLTFVGSKS